MSALPPKPYHYMTTAKPGDHEGFGHVYLCDVTGKKIASLWGKPDAKKALLQLILDAANGESADATKTAAAKSPAPERPMRERWKDSIKKWWQAPADGYKSDDMLVAELADTLISELRTSSAAVRHEAMLGEPAGSLDELADRKADFVRRWQAAIDAISKGK